MHVLWLSFVATMAIACAYSLWSAGDAIYQIVFGSNQPSKRRLIADLARALSFGCLLVTVFARKKP